MSLCRRVPASGLLALIVTVFSSTSVHAAGLLYVLNDIPSGNQIYGYSVDEASGALTLLPGFPVATGGNGDSLRPSERLKIDRTNQRLYAINGGSLTLSAYSINASTGALTALPFSPIALGAGQWRTVAVHPSGSPVLTGAVLNNVTGLLASFQITATTATAAAGSPFDMGEAEPFSMCFSHDGSYVYSGGQTISTVAGFSVDASSGVLTTLAGSPFDSGNSFPVAYVTDTAGRLLLANSSSAQVRAFTTSNGIPSAVAGNPFSDGLTTAVHGALHPNGFYMVADRGNNGAPPGNQVAVFRINGIGSATTLNPVQQGQPFASGGTTTDALALNGAGTFLFAANGDSRNVSVFPVNPSTGILSAPAVQPADSLGATGRLGGMAYLPSLTISPATLPAPKVGTPYSQMFTASGGTGPYSFSITAGVLPDGMTLSADGLLSGTPTQEGEFTFAISATESNTVGNPVSLLAMYTLFADLQPAFTSGPAFTPDPAVTDLTATFMAGVVPADAVVTWDFGDGSPLATGVPVQHIYTVAGTYNVSVKAVNPRSGSTTTAPLSVVVSDATVQPGSSAILAARGTIRFAKRADSLSLDCDLQLDPGQTAEGLSMTLTLNGLTNTLLFNKKGVAPIANGQAHLRVRKKASSNGANAKLSIRLKGQLKTALSTGVTLDAAGLPKKLLVLIQYNSKSFSEIVSLSFVRGQARFK